MISLFNEDCVNTMHRLIDGGIQVDAVLTSPPYNTGRPSTSERGRENYEGRYDVHLDTMTQQEYIDWCCELFNLFDKILVKNGVVLWNVSYGSDGSVNVDGIDLMWLSIADIIRNTDFMVADRIIWKKSSALPNNVSPNKLTRIVEDVFVFCRKSEYDTYSCNKEVSQTSKSGQVFYRNYFNFIEAKNNDGVCNLNKATYSTDLCLQLLGLYISNKGDKTIYDPFMGTGTTAVACVQLGFNCIGSELSADQVQYSLNRMGIADSMLESTELSQEYKFRNEYCSVSRGKVSENKPSERLFDIF